MPKINKINHWILGEATVEAPVEVVNTEFYTWEADKNGVFPVWALHYSVLHPHVMARDEDLRGDTPFTSVMANIRSLLWPYGVADMASRMNVVTDAGEPYGPIDVRTDDAEIAGLGLRLDTATLRQQTAEFYRNIGGISLGWIGEPPIVPVPLESKYFFPLGIPGEEE